MFWFFFGILTFSYTNTSSDDCYNVRFDQVNWNTNSKRTVCKLFIQHFNTIINFLIFLNLLSTIPIFFFTFSFFFLAFWFSRIIAHHANIVFKMWVFHCICYYSCVYMILMCKNARTSLNRLLHFQRKFACPVAKHPSKWKLIGFRCFRSKLEMYTQFVGFIYIIASHLMFRILCIFSLRNL